MLFHTFYQIQDQDILVKPGFLTFKRMFLLLSDLRSVEVW